MFQMTVAFVLVNVQAGAEEEILDTLKKLEHVREVYAIYGIYDLLVKVEADSLEKIKETVNLKLRKLEKVRSSLTMVVVEKYVTS